MSLLSFDETIAKAEQYIGSEWYDETLFVSPKLWTPFNQENEKEHLESTARGIIHAVQAEECELADIGWKNLEEIVAEILRSKGLKIHMVTESPQGGRDIIAKGELVPGLEVVTMAVEVKKHGGC